MTVNRVVRRGPKYLAIFILVVFGASRPISSPLQAKDGSGLDKITWSGTIRFQRELHIKQNSTDRDEVVTGQRDVVVTTEYRVDSLPHDAELSWRNSDISAHIQGSENSLYTHKGDKYVRNNQVIKNVDGNTTGYAMLMVRGEGDRDTGHCWLETGFIGQRDDGKPLAKPLDYNGTSHSWGYDNGHSYDISDPVKEQERPEGSQFEFPCEKGATSLHGSKIVLQGADQFVRAEWDLTQDGEARTEVEIVPPDGYDQWLPQADEDEKKIGNDIDISIVAHTKGDPSLKPPKKVLKYKITLADTSRERGVDCNWPERSKSTDGYDMKIDPDNGWITVKDEDGQSAETKEEDLTEFRVAINSYDWGGHAKLKVIAELEGGESVVAHVRNHPDQDTLALPKDENTNHIADWWEHWFDLKDTNESADEDNMPQGDGDRGDSIALYEEYRGFHIQGKHERLSPEIKDLFIWDSNNLGAGNYQEATGVHTHLISVLEKNVQGGANNQNVITPNGRYGDVYALHLVDGVITNGDGKEDSGAVGDTDGGPSVPINIKKITINSALVRGAYGGAGGAALSSTIAHELGHGTNVWHHGEGPPDYSVGDARCKRKDGSFKNYLCSEWPTDAKTNKATGPGKQAFACWEVAAKGGKYSGNDQCLMRYDMTNFYETPSGDCQWQHNGKTVKGNRYGQDPPGTIMCESPRGTGVNDASNPNNKAGDASPGRGDCAHKLCLRNSKH